MLHSKTFHIFSSLLLLCLFLSACGEGGGPKGSGIDEDTDVTGSIQLPEAADPDAEYPATIQAFYSEKCTEPEPDAVFSDANGNYDILINCGSDGDVFLVYASRTGNYGLISKIIRDEDSAGETISASVALEPMEPATVTVTIGPGYNGAYDHAELQFGLYSSRDREIVPIHSMLTYDGTPVFTDHTGQLTESGVFRIARTPLQDNTGKIHGVSGSLIGTYSQAGQRVQGSLETGRVMFNVLAGEENTATLDFDATLSFLNRRINFTSNGVYDPEPYRSGPTDSISPSTRLSLSQIPYRQETFHLTLTFMDNLSVSMAGVPVVSGVAEDFDLIVKPVEDIVVDIFNTVTGETFTHTFEFTSDALDDSTHLSFYYRYDSEIRGIFTTNRAPQIFKPTPYNETFDVFVDYTVEEVELTFTLANDLQALTINGEAHPEVTYLGDTYTKITPSIVDGDNLFELLVTSEDPDVTSTYLLTVFRSKPYNANLRTLDLTYYYQPLISGFSPDTTFYTASTESRYVGLTANAYASATIRVLLNNVETGSARTQFDGTLALDQGLNTITIEVTSADGTVTKIYTIDITSNYESECIPGSDIPCETS